MKFYRIALVLIFISGVIYAQPPIPDPAGRWVIDDAGVLSGDTEGTISALCQEEFDSTSNQVVVYTFSSLEGSTIEAYAQEVFEAWSIGQEEHDNGVLFIIAIDDHKMRIHTGYGIEEYLTDLEAADILDNEVTPSFKEGDFDHGVLNGVEGIMQAIRGTYTPPERIVHSQLHVKHRRNRYFSWTKVIIGCLVWAALCVLFSRASIGEAYFTYCFASLMGLLTWTVFMGLVTGISMFVGGAILIAVLHFLWKPKKKLKFFSGGGGSYSGSTWTSSSYNSSSSSYSGGSSWSGGGGGGFSGGGGSSGGGGASGSW